LRFLAAALGLTVPCFFVVITSFVSDSLVESSTGMILFGLLAADVFAPFAGDFFAPFATDVLTLLLRDVPFEFYYFSNNI
jgi:hypothetical protein